ncbi:hypothetical protein YTPLAS18_14440 [Nitrospira sp.]|nr:hypothetical protein YTPLAS18_14440 [Nitrospira sp.]
MATPIQATPISVQTVKPQRRDLVKSLSLPANVSPWQQATLYAKVPGYLKWVGVDKGDHVKKGQLLATIDAPEVEQQFQQADADYRIKQITAERLMNVWKDNPDVIAKQDVDVAEAAASAAKHARDSRKTLLHYTQVIAPFAGTITARFADPGAMIQAATGSATQAVPLFTIMDITTVRVYVSVPQEAALLSSPGVRAILTARELPGRDFEGTITRTTEALDPATRSLLVEVDLPNPDGMLRPGMFVTMTLLLQEHPQVLTVPPAALVPNDQGRAAFVVQGGTVTKVPVKTGLDDGVWVEITEGLDETQEVVVVGRGQLKDGQVVQTSPYNLPPGKPARQKM